MDLIYLINLGKYHAVDKPVLGIKKQFLNHKYLKMRLINWLNQNTINIIY